MHTVRSNDSDSAFDDKDTGHSLAQTWRKRTSLYRATDSPGSQSESDEVSHSDYLNRGIRSNLFLRFWTDLYRTVLGKTNLNKDQTWISQGISATWYMKRIYWKSWKFLSLGNVLLYSTNISWTKRTVQYRYIVFDTSKIEINSQLALSY